MSLKDLTVVVATYSRQRYVDRQVAYWTELGANLLILDGSPQAHPNRLQWEAFPNVVYVHSTTTYRDRHLMQPISLHLNMQFCYTTMSFY